MMPVFELEMRQEFFIFNLIIGLLAGCHEKSNQLSNGSGVATTQQIQIKYVKAKEVVNGLRQVFSDENHEIQFSVADDVESVEIQTRNESLLARAITTIKELDQPASDPHTEFVSVKWVDLDMAAMAMKLVSRNETFQAVAEPRTRRMFLMGSPSEIKRATGILRMLDAASAVFSDKR